MKRVSIYSLGACMVLAAAPVFGQSSTFTLGFTGQNSYSGAAGTPWSGMYDATLTSAGAGPGAQGWSMSATAENATLTSITYAGTVAANKADGGKEDAGFADFQPTQPPAGPVTCPGGGTGVVAAVVLSFRKPIVLAQNATHIIAKIGVEGTIPAGGGTATIKYLNNCEGAGEPVENVVTEAGGSVIPTLVDLPIALIEITPPAECCTKPFNVGFSAVPLNNLTPYTGFVETPDVPPTCDANGGTIAVDVAPGATGETKVYAGISSNNAVAGKGAQGWSMSIKQEGDVTVTFATAAGTVGGPKSEGGLQDAGFEQTELALPENNDGMRGVVTAVVLSFRKPITLPAVGTASVLCMTVQAAAPQGAPDQVGTLRFLAGLEGSGEPVDNVITVEGGSAVPCNADTGKETAAVSLLFRQQIGEVTHRFLRGNANNDRKVNIADPIWIVNELFRGGPPTVCREAANANGDAMVGDISDVSYLISYQFSGGPAPPGPFPLCDQAPVDKCAEDQLVCLP